MNSSSRNPAHSSRGRASAERTRWLAFLAAAVSLTPALVGCGGGGSISASDMRKYAIKRPSDEEESPTTTVASSARTTNGGSPTPSFAWRDEGPSGSTSTPAASEIGSPLPNSRAPQPDVAEPSSSETDAIEAVQPKESDEASAENAVDEPDEQPAATSHEPLSHEQRLAKSAENLEQISAALLAYLENKNVVPPAASYDSAGTPLLSWRVLILPYLGHQELFDQFKVTEPWYTPHNKRLIDKIPSVFLSPERRDTKTNYLAVVGGSAAFDPSRRNGVHPRRFDDGLENTVLVVEADDEAATTWTQPDEYQVDPVQPTAQLGKLRDGFFLVVWGSGLVGLVPATAPREQIAAMYSRDGGEIFSFSMVNRPLEMALQQAAAGAGLPSALAPTLPTSPNTDRSTTAQGTHGIASGPLASSVQVAASGPASLHGLAGEYFTSAAAAYQAGAIPAALRWWYAGVIVSPASSADHNRFLWVPGLKRPRPAVQFAVGVEYSGRAYQQQNHARTRAAIPGLSGDTWIAANRKSHDDVLKLTEPFGGTLLEGLEEHAESTAASWIAPAVPQTTGPLRRSTAHVVYLGAGMDHDLMREAVDDACDVLVLFDVKDSSLGTSRTVSFRVIDLERRENLAESPQIVWRASSREDPVDELEEFRQSFWRIRDTLRDQLMLTEWPSQIQPRHAQARVNQLAQSQSLNPLVRLAEMTVYRHRGLIDDEQLFAGYRAMLGESDAISLLLGSEEKKRRVLRQWLPTTAPDPPDAAARRTGRVRDTDD